MIISPFARKGFVDKTVYDTTSILRTIEARFGLAPLGARDRGAADLRHALEPAQNGEWTDRHSPSGGGSKG